MKLTATPGSALEGEAAIPGDKSCSHRALIFGARLRVTSPPLSMVRTNEAPATQLDGEPLQLQHGSMRQP